MRRTTAPRHLSVSSASLRFAHSSSSSSNRKNTRWEISELERESSRAAQMRNAARNPISTITTPRNQTELRISFMRAPTMANFMESLEDVEDDTGYRGVGDGQHLNFEISKNSSSSSSLLPTSPIPIDAERFAAPTREEPLIGPASVTGLLPWLTAPSAPSSAIAAGGTMTASGSSIAQMKQRTYLGQAEVASGRKENWARTISDETRRKQLVDILWTYICDAEEQTRLVERDTISTFKRAKQNSEEFTYWIRRMQDEGEDVFFEWADPDDVTTEKRRQLQLEALNKQQKMLALPSSSSSSSSSNEQLATAEQQRIDKSLFSKLKRKQKQSDPQNLRGDIGINTPLAPYEDLPFLKMRMQENPDSLDPALRAWAEQNLEGLEEKDAQQNDSTNIDEDEEVVNNTNDVVDHELYGSGGVIEREFATAANTNNNDTADDAQYLKTVSTSSTSDTDNAPSSSLSQSSSSTMSTGTSRPPLSQEQKEKRKQDRRIRKFEAARRLFSPTGSRVKARHTTFDNEGVYFHVAPSSKQFSTNLSTQQQQQKQQEQEDSNDYSKSLDQFVTSSSSSASPLKHFFKPKMVKVTDDISGGVVKIDWPTVRAAYAGKRKTDYSREDQAAARERIIRLCRGEDPNTL